MEPRPSKLAKTEAAEIEPKPQLLPDDLVLDIVSRCPTIADVVRCAATSKPIRRGVLNAPFLRRLRGILISNDRLMPARNLLPGLYEYHQNARQPAFAPLLHGGVDLTPLVTALSPAPDGNDDGACEFGPYLPVASRRSLLVLRRQCRNHAKEHLVERHGLHPVELSVCNPTTGERFVLPPHDVQDMSHVLLDVDPIAPSSFKLLVAELPDNDPRTLYVQIFSSEEGQWSPPRYCPIIASWGDRVACEFAGAGRPRPVVVGDTVHWLCTTDVGGCILMYRWRGAGVPQEASIALQPRWPVYSVSKYPGKKCLAVVTSPGSQARLSFVVLKRGEIKILAHEGSGVHSDGRSYTRWEQWRCIQEASIPRPTDFCKGWLSSAKLSWFCEDSNTLFLRAGDGIMSPLLLDLETKKVMKLEARKPRPDPEREFYPYVVDLLSYMLLMKQYITTIIIRAGDICILNLGMYPFGRHLIINHHL